MRSSGTDNKFRLKEMTPADVFLPGVLVLFSFIHFNLGADYTDIGYNLANYANFPDVNPTWLISTVLSVITGKFFSLLPGGRYMLGMNIYCTLFFALFILAVFFCMRKVFPAPAVFLGELAAISFSWCPKTILYHYMTYFLFTIAALILVYALVKEKKSLLLVAGGVLALNSFVRFPNVTECALIVVVFFYGIIGKRHIIKEFLCCIAGFAVVFLAGFGLVELAWGKGAYVGMINGLFGMTDEAESYTPVQMVLKELTDYKQYLPYFLIMALVVFTAMLVYNRFKQKAVHTAVYIVTGICFVFIPVLMRYRNDFNFDYSQYASVFAWGALFLCLCASLFAYAVLSPKFELPVRLLSMAGLVIIFITPLGSNNGLYTAFNNMYLIAPLCMGILFKGPLKDNPKLAMLRFGASVFSAFVLVQSFIFGTLFVFHSPLMFSDSYKSFTANERLKGMRAEAGTVEEIEALTGFVEANGADWNEALFYDDIPMLSYCLDIKSSLSHSWPALLSYPTEEFKAELDSMDEAPVVFYSATHGDFLEDGEYETIKDEAFAEFLKDNSYSEIYRDERVVICLPQSMN